MDERLKSTPEKQRGLESRESSKSHETPSESQQSPKHEHNDNIEQIRAKAEKEATNAREVPTDREDKHHRPTEAFVNKELKQMAYERNLQRVRRHLSPAGRRFSKFIHRPVVDSVSEGAAKTVGRPSGLMGAGIVALVGTSVYYYLTKHYGYEYSYTVFLLLLAGGLILGWCLEALYRLIRR